MKNKTKQILTILASLVVIVAASCLIAYYGFYARVYNQSNLAQNTVIDSNIEELTLERIVSDMVAFPDRFAGNKCQSRTIYT